MTSVERIPSEPFEARLVACRPLSPSVRELVFERVDGAPMRFHPGQWVNLFFTIDGEEVKRAYSIASAPSVSPSFEISVTKVSTGPVSTRLHTLEPGAIVRAVGPSGLFTRDPKDDAPALFVGTGTGVTPLRSMFRSALAEGSNVPLALLLGVRTEADILYREEFEALAARHPNFRFEVTLSRGSDAWLGKRGYVQNWLKELHGGLASERAHVFVCGLDHMIKAVREVCKSDLHLDRKHIHQERYD